MRAKNFSTGLQGVLFEERHYARMGQAVWLYGWLVLRQTRQVGTMGLVLGGKPVSYREIAEETGFHPRTLERWMRVLRREGYVETSATPGGITIRITKAKKYPQRPVDFQARARKSAGTLLDSAGQCPQNCGAIRSQVRETAAVPNGIGSRYIEDKKRIYPPQQTSRIETRNATPETHRRVPNEPNAHRTDPNAMSQHWLDRKEALEELVRRELAAGQGPELSNG